MDHPRRNWIGGTARPAAGGRTFLPGGAWESGEAKPAWAASTEADVDLALDALGIGAQPRARANSWISCSRGQRRQALTDLVRRLVACPDPGGGTTGLLGLRQEELKRSAEERQGVWLGALDRPGCGASSGGLALVSVHWSAGVWGQVEAVLRSLADGWPTVLVTDPYLPSAGDALASAALGLPPDALAVLHGDTDEALGRLLRDAAALHLIGSRPLGRLGEVAEPWSLPPSVREQAMPHSGFGAGVLEHPPRSRSLLALTGTVVCLSDGGDDVADARVLGREAFGRLEALSGQAAGRPSHILCPERRLSAFTEALLATLAEDEDLAPALPRRDASCARRLEDLCATALDGGATLLHLGPPGSPGLSGPPGSPGPLGTGAAGAPGNRPGGSKKGHLGRRMDIAVFTNVEESMGLGGGGAGAWPGPPVPALALMRVKDEAHGRRLAGRRGANSPLNRPTT